MFAQTRQLPRRICRNFRHNPLLASASIVTVTIALSILAAFALVVLNVQQLAHQSRSRIGIIAYLDTPADNARQQQLLAQIRQLPQVKAADYISPAQAMERFRSRLGSQSQLVEGIDPQVLPASVEIRLQPGQRHSSAIATVVDKLKQLGLTDLHYGRQWLERFETFVRVLRLVALGLAGFLLFAAMVIVANTIKLTLYARQDELQVMALVGATRLYIKGPFLAEGALQGAIGGLLALVSGWVLFKGLLQPGLASLLCCEGNSTVLFLPPGWQLGLVLLGTALGFIGSLIALRRFVRLEPC